MRYDIICNSHHGLRSVMKNDVWGLINEENAEVIPLQFETQPLGAGKYFICKKDKKFGLVDFEGKETIPFIYDTIIDLRIGVFAVSQGMNKKIIDLNTNITFQIDYDKIMNVLDKYYILLYGDLCDVINKNGEMIISAQYKDMSIVKDYAILRDKKKNVSLLDLLTNTLIVKHGYSDIQVITRNCIAVKNRKGKWGFCDKAGIEKIHCQYDGYIYEVAPSCLIVNDKNKYGVIDVESQKQLVPAIYDSIRVVRDYIEVQRLGKFGIMDFEYNIIVPVDYESIDIIDSNHAIVSRGFSNKGLYDLKNGKILCDSKYRSIDKFYEGYAVVSDLDYRYGYIDEQGNEIIKCKYYSASRFSNGYAAVSKKFGKYGYINKNGEEVTPFIYYSANCVSASGIADVVYYNQNTYDRIYGKIYLEKED